MSRITGLILITDFLGEDKEDMEFKKINGYIKEKYNCTFNKINRELAGGNKVFCASISMAAINYFDTSDFIDFLTKLVNESNYYDNVQLLVQREEEFYFKMYDIKTENF